MSDAYGALPIPETAPASTDVAGDPAITYLSACLYAVLRADLDTAWLSISPGRHVVQKVYTADPEAEFIDTHLPALWVWRGRKHFERIADDWRIDRSAIELLWLPDPAAQEIEARRGPFLNAVADSIDAAIFQGRHPSWVVAGDPDPTASARGSSLHNYCGFSQITVIRDATQVSPITIEMQDASPIKYRGLRMTVEAIERLTRDPTADPRIYNSAVHIDVENTTPTVLDQVEG